MRIKTLLRADEWFFVTLPWENEPAYVWPLAAWAVIEGDEEDAVVGLVSVGTEPRIKPTWDSDGRRYYAPGFPGAVPLRTVPPQEGRYVHWNELPEDLRAKTWEVYHPEPSTYLKVPKPTPTTE